MGQQHSFEAAVEYVARAISQAAGFHAEDWEHTLTEQERTHYRALARVAIEAVHAYEATLGSQDARPEA